MRIFRFLWFHQWTRTFKAVQSAHCSLLLWWLCGQNCFNSVWMWFSVFSFYFNIESKNFKGRNWIESNIRITSSSGFFLISSQNNSFSFSFSISILSVSHNRVMKRYFLLMMSDSKHWTRLSYRFSLVCSSLFVSISNWFNSSTSFFILFD